MKSKQPQRTRRAGPRDKAPAAGGAPAESRSLPHRLRALLSHRRGTSVVFALGLLLALPALGIGFYQDDYNLIVALRHGTRPFYDLYRFATGELHDSQALVASGDYPFWIAQDFKLHLIRPLASALFSMDDVLFGDGPLGYHVHALAWYAALLLAASILFRKTLAPASATVAFLVFALRTSHTMAFAWISARHAVVGAALSTFALLAHMRAVRDGSARAQAFATGLLLLAFSGSEVALGIVPFWLGFDLVEARRKGGMRQALGASAPAIALAVAYLAAYSSLGGGAHAAAGYRSPFTDPMAFLESAVTRIPVYLGDALVGVPAEIGATLSGLESVALTILAIGFCYAVFRVVRRGRDQEMAALTWLGPAALLALGPGLATLWGHALLIPDLGFAAILGTLLEGAIEEALDATSSMRRLGLAVASVALVGCHLLAPPFLTVRTVQALSRRSEIVTRMAMTAELEAPAKTVFVVAAPDAMTYFYEPNVLEALAPERLRCWSTLVPTNGRYRLTRTGPRSLRLEELEPPRDDRYKSFFAASRWFAVGEQVEQCGAKIRIDAVRAGTPTVLQVEADSLDGARVELLGMWSYRLHRVPIPAVGESIRLPRLDGST